MSTQKSGWLEAPSHQYFSFGASGLLSPQGRSYKQWDRAPEQCITVNTRTGGRQRCRRLSLCVQSPCWPWLFASLMLSFQGFLSSRKLVLVLLDACPPFPWQGQPSSPRAAAAAPGHMLHLCRGHGVSCCLQARPSICRVVLTLPFCLLFTIFQICPFWFSPRCCLQSLSSSRMASGLVCRTLLLWVSSSLSLVGLEKTLVVLRHAAGQCSL